MLISIVTPVYNRAFLLKRLYDSIVNSSNIEFSYIEWIVIDDGSSDDIDSVVGDFIDDALINIIYKKKSNGGKHSALNLAFEISSGDYLVIVDSDDYFTVNGLSYILENANHDINIFKHGVNDAIDFRQSFLDLNGFLSIKGDMIFVFRKAILDGIRFPIHDGECFVTEATVFNRLLDVYGGYCFSFTVVTGSYLPDGLSASYLTLLAKNPSGVFDLIQTNLHVKKNTLNIIKQTAYHFSSIFGFSTVIRLFRNESFGKSCILLLATIFVLIKRRFNSK